MNFTQTMLTLNSQVVRLYAFKHGPQDGSGGQQKKNQTRRSGFFPCLPDQLLTRLRYSFVRVSISILSPMAQNSGTFSS